MTNAQKWIAIFLGLFLILFGITYLTEPNDAENSEYTENTNLLTGDEIYKNLNCSNCHGQNSEGTKLAPPLKNLSDFWTKAKLVNYLRNPSDFKHTDRIIKLKEKYSGTLMPQYDGVEIKKLGILVEYLLEK